MMPSASMALITSTVRLIPILADVLERRDADTAVPFSSIQRAPLLRQVEREGGDVNVERLARFGHHAVAAGHEARWRRQRHAAGVFEILARLEHRFLADHAVALDLLQAPE